MPLKSFCCYTATPPLTLKSSCRISDCLILCLCHCLNIKTGRLCRQFNTPSNHELVPNILKLLYPPLVESHGLRFGGADSHFSCYTLDHESFQCTVRFDLMKPKKQHHLQSAVINPWSFQRDSLWSLTASWNSVQRILILESLRSTFLWRVRAVMGPSEELGTCL